MKRLLRLRELSFQDVNPILLGAISIGLIFAVIAGVFAVGTLGLLRSRYEMSGVFTDSAGARPGDVVRVAGLDVGKINAVQPDFTVGQVIITWEVDQDVRLGPKTTAELATATLLGGIYIRLGGQVVEPYMASVPTKQRRIPLERTKTPSSVTDVLNKTTTAVQQLDVTKVDTLLNQLGDLTLDNGQDIGQLAQDLATVAAAINQRQTQLEQLLASTQQITATLASKDQALAVLVDNASVLLDEIARRRDGLATLLGAGAEVVTTLSNLITEHRTQLQAIIDDVHATLAVTDAHLPELNRELAFLGPTFAGVATATRHGPWIDAVSDSLPGADITNLINLIAGALPP